MISTSCCQDLKEKQPISIRRDTRASFKISRKISPGLVGVAFLWLIIDAPTGTAPPVNPCMYANCDTTAPPIAPDGPNEDKII